MFYRAILEFLIRICLLKKPTDCCLSSIKPTAVLLSGHSQTMLGRELNLTTRKLEVFS
jgi:hypothetical protein